MTGLQDAVQEWKNAPPASTLPQLLFVRKISSSNVLQITLVQVLVYTTSIFLIQVSTHIHFTSFFLHFMT